MGNSVVERLENKIEETKAKYNEEIKRLENQKQAAIIREKEKERKNRTNRLIQLGEITEKHFKIDLNASKEIVEMQFAEIEKTFEMYCEQKKEGTIMEKNQQYLENGGILVAAEDLLDSSELQSECVETEVVEEEGE